MKPGSLTHLCLRRGISLIEGVLYLVVALAVIVGGIVFFQQAQLSSQITDTARIGTSISSELRNAEFGPTCDGTNMCGGGNRLTSLVIRMGAVPSHYAAEDELSILTVAGSDIQVWKNYDDFLVQINNMTRKACLRLAVVGEGGTGPMGSGMSGIIFSPEATPGNDMVHHLTDGKLVPTHTPPVNPDSVASICADGIDVAFLYDK